MASLPPYPRKRLGQHFLIDPNLLRKIVSLADIQPSDSVCDIGTGRGELTKLLCQTAKQVLALEVDTRMVVDMLADHQQLVEVGGIIIIAILVLNQYNTNKHPHHSNNFNNQRNRSSNNHKLLHPIIMQWTVQ